MRTIEHVLLTLPLDGPYLAHLQDAVGDAEIERVDAADDAALSAALERADVAVVRPGGYDDRFAGAPRLRWIHCDSAGIESWARPELLRRGVAVTGSAGRSAPVLAEHVFFFMLSLAYGSTELGAAQRAHRWGVESYETRRGLYGRTVGIVGLGATGSELAARAKAFGMRVIAYRRSKSTSAPGVDRLLIADYGDSLSQLLSESDIVVLAVPLSNETYHLIGRRELGLMKPTALLINMARGAVLDEEALVEALRARRIAGAGLDTFNQEPLPPDSPLWDLPNVVITPHTTPKMPDPRMRSLEIICENARRFREERPLLNAVTERDAFERVPG